MTQQTAKGIRTYTESLERVINTGVDLRESLREQLRKKDEVISLQLRRIKQLETEKDDLREEKLQRKIRKDDMLAPKLAKAMVNAQKQSDYIARLKAWIMNHNGGSMPEDI